MLYPLLMVVTIHQPPPPATVTAGWVAGIIALVISVLVLVVTLVGLARGISSWLDQVVAGTSSLAKAAPRPNLSDDLYPMNPFETKPREFQGPRKTQNVTAIADSQNQHPLPSEHGQVLEIPN
jgi:hypothetical protein